MTYIGYKKVYGMVSNSWILECLDLVQDFRVSDKVSMKNLNTELTSRGKLLTWKTFNVKSGIFQGDSLSPLLFVFCRITLTQMQREVISEHTLKSGEKLNHLIYMESLKIFGKNESEINGLVLTVQIFSKDMGMEFRTKGVVCL